MQQQCNILHESLAKMHLNLRPRVKIAGFSYSYSLLFISFVTSEVSFGCTTSRKGGLFFSLACSNLRGRGPSCNRNLPKKTYRRAGGFIFLEHAILGTTPAAAVFAAAGTMEHFPPTHTAVDGSFKYPSMPLIPINNVNSWRHVTVSLYLCPTWYRVLRPSTAIHYTWYCDYIVSNINIPGIVSNINILLRKQLS